VRCRQHKLSALIDTGSDVSIAGQDVARKMGWPIYAHHTKEVSVANNKTMSILGAARVVLVVAGHGVELEVLIAPDLDGLILGIDWLRSQGRVKWDFDRGRIKFGKRDWVALIQETEQPCWTSIIRKGFSTTDHENGLYHRGSDSDRPAFHAAPTGSARRFCCSTSDRVFLREVPLLCRAMLLAENGRECCKTSEPGIRHGVSGIRHRVRDDVIATLSLYPPCPPWARYLIVRSTRRILWRLFHFRLSSSEVPSTEECTKLKMAAVRLEHLQEPQNYEGKTPEMSSVTRLVSPRRGDILEGELGPYIPSSPVEDLSTKEVADGPHIENTSNIGTEEAVRTTGEVHFGNAESANGPTHPFPILGVAAESTDELMTPPPTTIQLERNRSDLSPDLTDGKKTPASAESMETAELKEFCPLADCQLDTAEDYLHPATGSISQDTGSSGTPATRNLPDQNTGSRDIQETGSLESQTAEESEAAIVAS